MPIIFGVFLGPLLLALWGAAGRACCGVAGAFFALGATAAMADIGARAVVPGANDNLSAVARARGAGPRAARAAAARACA